MNPQNRFRIQTIAILAKTIHTALRNVTDSALEGNPWERWSFARPKDPADQRRLRVRYDYDGEDVIKRIVCTISFRRNLCWEWPPPDVLSRTAGRLTPVLTP